MVYSYEDGETYKYSGARTVESLKQMALKMLQPVVKEFTIKQFNELHDRYTVSFLYIINDQEIDKESNSQNTAKFTKIAKKFRPEIPFYAIKYSQVKTKKKDFIENTLKIKSSRIHRSKQSIITAITPSIPNTEYKAEQFDEREIQKFIEQNRFAPIIEMKLGNYKDLVENCEYFAIIFISGQTDIILPNELKFRFRFSRNFFFCFCFCQILMITVSVI